MAGEFLPLRVLLLSCSGWVQRQQQDVIGYLVEENRVLRGQISDRRSAVAADGDGCTYSAERPWPGLRWLRDHRMRTAI